MTTTPVIGPLPDTALAAAAPAPGSLLQAISDDPTALVYFLLNVGDGDTQLLLLPPDSNDGHRRLVIVDVATPKKLPALINALHSAGLIDPPGTPGLVRLLVATHPHFDHIGGIPDLLDQLNGPTGCIEQFWDPGYYLATPTFHGVMTRLEASPWVRRLQPTAGTTLHLDSVQITVLGPGIGLRNRFDTYGVGINDSSITLMVTYPGASIVSVPDPHGDRTNRRATSTRPRRLLLGADAQFTSWAQTTVDFPALTQDQNSALAAELRAALGIDHLKADVFKISHHASKHGINLEVLERVGAPISLVSSVAGGGKYGFPHLLAVEAAREARQPVASHPETRSTDLQLGLHFTGSELDTGAPCGSIALVIPAGSAGDIRLFRLMDKPGSAPNLGYARELSA